MLGNVSRIRCRETLLYLCENSCMYTPGENLNKPKQRFRCLCFCLLHVHKCNSDKSSVVLSLFYAWCRPTIQTTRNTWSTHTHVPGPFFHLAMGCLLLPLPANGRLVHTARDTAKYACEASFVFADTAASSRELHCTEHYTWDKALPDCVGKSEWVLCSECECDTGLILNWNEQPTVGIVHTIPVIYQRLLLRIVFYCCWCSVSKFIQTRSATTAYRSIFFNDTGQTNIYSIIYH